MSTRRWKLSQSSSVTEIGGVSYILRGYERIDEKLKMLGAHIERISYEDSAF